MCVKYVVDTSTAVAAAAAEYYARGPPGRRCHCQCPVRWAVTSARDLVQWASSTSRRPRRQSSVPSPFTHPGDVFAIILVTTRRRRRHRRHRRRRRRELRCAHTPHRLPLPPPTDRVALVSDKTVALPAGPRPSVRPSRRVPSVNSIRCPFAANYAYTCLPCYVHALTFVRPASAVRVPPQTRVQNPVDFTKHTHVITVCSMFVHRPHT